MLYYDPGMFDQITYQTSAIPAEVATGGIYLSMITITRTIFPTLTRATQTIRLTNRGDERLPDVKMVDLRVSRSFRFAGRQITPLFEIFNLGNADTSTGVNNNVGNTYLRPTEILSPRILRLGVSIDF